MWMEAEKMFSDATKFRNQCFKRAGPLTPVTTAALRTSLNHKFGWSHEPKGGIMRPTLPIWKKEFTPGGTAWVGIQ